MKFKFKAGDEASWLSKSGGYEKLKTGTIVGICLAGASPQSVHSDLAKIPDRSPRWAGGYSNISSSDRYVIAVPRGGKSLLTDFYMPKIYRYL